MKLTINRNLVILLDFLFGIILGVLLLVNIVSYTAVFYISLFLYIYMLFTWTKLSKSVFNYFNVFLLLTYIYYFSQIAIDTFGFKILNTINLHNTFGNESICHTAIYLLLNMIIVHCFAAVSYKKKKSIVIPKVLKFDRYFYNTNKKIKSYSYLMLLVLSVSFICEVLVLYFKYKLNVTMGYTVALGTPYSGAGSLSSLVNFFSTFYLPALFAALIITKENKKVNLLVWGTYAVYLILYFLSGSRFEAVVSLAGIVLLLNYEYRKIKIKELVLIGVVGVVVLFACSLMSNIRAVNAWNRFSSYADVLEFSLDLTIKNNFLLSSVSIAGGQLLTVTAVMENCPGPHHFTYGLYYIQGLYRLIPNVFFGSNNPLITTDIDTIFHVYLTKTYGMGSSFIVEAYYNFGYLGIIMMPIYGLLIGVASNFIDNVSTLSFKNISVKAFVFYITSSSFFWIRSDARMLPREIVYYYFSFIFMVWVLSKIKIKDK